MYRSHLSPPQRTTGGTILGMQWKTFIDFLHFLVLYSNQITQTSCRIKYMYTCSMKPTEKCSSTFHSSDEGTHTMYSQGPVSKAITVNPERLASIIFSVFLTGPLLTSIKFNVFGNINTRQYTYMYMQSKP